MKIALGGSCFGFLQKTFISVGDGLHHVGDSVDIQGDELIDNIGHQPVPLVWLQSWQFE